MCGSLKPGRVESPAPCRGSAPARSRRRARRSRRTAAAFPDSSRRAAFRRRRARASRASKPPSRSSSIPAGNAPTPGSTSPSARAQQVVVGRQKRPRPDALDGLLDRAPVAERRSRRCRSSRPAPLTPSASPWWTGTPLSVGSIDDGLAQRAREGLEGRLDHVVGVGAALDIDVQRQLRRAGDARGRTRRRARGPCRRSRRAAARPRRPAAAGPETSIAHIARASSIGTTAWP